MTSGVRWVVDASVAVAWVHVAQATEQTDVLFEELETGASVYAPAIWPLEVANALLSLERRSRMTREERQIALDAVGGLEVEIDTAAPGLALSELSALASKYKLSVYDAAYLELAQRLDVPLACKDGPLRAAAVKAGVKVRP